MGAPDPAANPPSDVLERIIESGDMSERIDRSFLEQIPFLWIGAGIVGLVALYVVWRIVRRIHLHVEKKKDPFALPGRSYRRILSELQTKIREVSDRGLFDPEEEGRWLKLHRETEHAASRYVKLVDTFQTEVVEKDIQLFGDLQSRFDEMVAAWKSMVEHAGGVAASMTDTEHLVNIRRRANDKLQEFLEAAKELETQYDRVVHQPQNLRHR
jgi:hypothetical protein